MKSLPLFRLLLGTAIVGQCALFSPDAQAAPAVGLKLVAQGLVQPTDLAELPDKPGHMLVCDQVGMIHLLKPDGSLTPYLDLRSKLAKLNQGFDERGLMGLALHPQFKTNRRFFVFYSAPLRAGGPAEWDHTSHLSEFKAGNGDSPTASLESEKILLQIDEPYFNHHGGRIAFGPDGYLYISTGDGGNTSDVGRGHPPHGNGQEKNTLLGKVLRIDVNAASGYTIPKDNPFANGGGRPEVFAYGFRNPWGLSFDSAGARELFVADVGQTLYEEINLVVKGGNYGWFLREGPVGFDAAAPGKPRAEAPKVGASGEPLIDPIVAYKNANGFKNDPEAKGISVTGGFVYRGKGIPELAGKYVFADWTMNWAVPRGVLMAATRPASATGSWAVEKLDLPGNPKGLGGYVVAFGQDASGELYVMTNESNGLVGTKGKVWKLTTP